MPSSIPPSRRRQPTSVRRPKVAGIRRPEGHSTSDVQSGSLDDTVEDTQVFPKIPAAVDEIGEVGAVDAVPERQPPPGRRRPSPTPKPRPERSATAVATVESTAELPAVDLDAEPDQRRGLVLPVVLGVTAVLLGGLAAWFGVEAANASGGGTNTALTDSATTSEVSGQVTSAVNTIFSYNYTDMGKTQKAVQQALTGNALCQYNELYKVVQQQAPGQKLVLTTTVQDKGVEMLQGGTARVLLLVQQHDTRATTNQQSDSQSMIAVNAVKQGGTWKISAIDTFNGTNPTSCKP